jgi:hypothetical protein
MCPPRARGANKGQWFPPLSYDWNGESAILGGMAYQPMPRAQSPGSYRPRA